MLNWSHHWIIADWKKNFGIGARDQRRDIQIIFLNDSIFLSQGPRKALPPRACHPQALPLFCLFAVGVFLLLDTWTELTAGVAVAQHIYIYMYMYI